LADADADVREQCAAGLADLAEAEEGREHPVPPATWDAASAALAGAARDTHPGIRCAAVRALVALAARGIAPSGIADVADGALADPAAEVRTEGLRLIAAANTPVADSLPHLTRLLGDPDADVRRRAARALGQLGADAAPAAPGLRAGLADADRRVARAAAEALALVLFAERPWVPYLLQVREFAGSARPDLRERATQLLDAPVEVVAESLGRWLEDRDEGVRWNAGLGLWRCGTAAGVARAGLARMLTDHSSALRVAAVVGLLGAGPAAGAESARAVALRLNDEEVWVRQLAAVALGAMGPAAVAALPALADAANDDREEVRTAAIAAMRAINVL
jgi:HEAT repeat protein